MGSMPIVQRRAQECRRHRDLAMNEIVKEQPSRHEPLQYSRQSWPGFQGTDGVNGEGNQKLTSPLSA